MALLSDFFIAFENELDQIDILESPVKSFTTLQANNTDVVKIVQLQCILDGSSYEDHLQSLDDLFIRDAGEDGPWIIQVPKIIVDRLSLANQPEVDEIGKKWAETEEWILDGGTPENIVPYIRQISKLAIMAKEADKHMYVWISL